MKRPRVDVNLEELDQIIDRGTHAPLSESEGEKLKGALHALAGMLAKPRSTEKTSAVLEPSEAPPPESPPAPQGHGRNGARSYTGAKKVAVPHPSLHAGDPCPGCGKGKVYPQKEPKTLVRMVGQAPLAATVYELDRLRCNLCGEVFTAEEPEGIGPEKYDETTAAMIALLKYGSGMPFYRLEKLEHLLGIPLPASTQWEIVEEAAEVIKAARDELIRQAAQGEVLHNDDTSMRVLRLAREPSDERTGVFTSGIVSTQEGRRIALYFTGRQHAGENLRDVLQHRTADLARPLQMCDALSRNTPKLTDGAEILLAHCLAHGRRQFVEVAANFPEPCRYVLETLGDIYKYDAEARERRLSPSERLVFHQQQSGPVMQQLHEWLEAQFALKEVEPNSGLGKAVTYLLRHWNGLTAFLREAGAPLDNNLCERALKRAVLHRKNALFYRTLHGAEAGDLFMSLIHTCELTGANPFDYLTELQRHAGELAANPSAWMPWNFLGQTIRLRPVMIDRCHTPGMPTKQAFPQTQSRRVFGHPLRVGLYARVSTHDQQTLPLQIRSMREYALKRTWTIVAQIKEVGSGASQRELREALIAAARRREIDVVLVWRLDRWGRSVADLVSTLQELQHLGVGFVSLTEALDLTTPAGRAMAGLLAVFAEFERDILRERVRAGLAHARQQGKHLGRPPSVVHNAAEVRKLCRQGISKSEIARRLEIGRTSVRRLLAQKKS